jgi:ATP-dependent helicase/nuclease subunit A
VSADDAARRAIAERLDATMLVEAGAGTGKTRALVDRVVALVAERGLAIERIAAITFTEKAAAELRERVRAELDRRVAEDGSPVARERCRVAREALDRAQLSTIHAFGQTLLRSLAAEARIDPELTVLDELTAERRFEERWRAAIERIDPDGPEGRALDRALGLGLDPGDLRTLGRHLAEREDIAERIAPGPPPCRPPEWGAVAELLAEVRELPLGAVTGDDPLQDHLLAVLDLLEELSAAGPEERGPRLVAAAVVATRKMDRRGAASRWGGAEAVAAARAVAARACEGIGRLLADERAEALAAVLPWVATVVRADAERRRREGTLVFDDLILWTRDLLRDDAGARSAVRERYDALLIDEFQDTDPWQVEIAEAFAGDGAGGLEPGRLFLVGDPKQSIYRFRRADMAVYERARRRVEEAGGSLLPLTVNRRSRAEIVDWVNAVVSGVIGEEADPTVQPRYAPILAERAAALAGPGIAWMGGPTGERAADMRRREAADVAATCLAAVAEGWQVQERDGAVRGARLGDVAVLIPARTGLQSLETALRDAGVPFRVEGGSLVFRTQELRDILNCLAAIDDPGDEVAVVGALRSPAFACSDVDLARHRERGLRFNYLAPAIAEAPGPVGEALRCLRAHHERRHDRSLASAVERFVAERRLVEIGMVDTGSRDAYRRARFVVEQARAFEAERPQGMRAFVAWMEERTSGPIFDRDGSGLDDDEDAVRILTVHAAKGLEFPVVILAGLGPRPAYARPPTYSLDASGGLVATIGAKGRGRLCIGDVEAVEAREARHAAAEAARLLYVATTRARDHLIVSLHHQEKYGSTGIAARLVAAGATDHAEEWVPPRAVAASRPPLGGLVADPAPAGDHHALRAELVARARRLRYTSATALKAEDERGAATADEPWSRGRGGTRVGRAVHASLQSLPLDAGDAAVAAVASAQAVAEAVPGRADEVAALVRAALRSEAAGRARRTVGALREVPFAMPADGAVVEGFVDLVVPDGGGVEIVDWKTDDVGPEGVEERLAGYGLQAGLYCAGLRAATGLPVTRVTYVFLRAGVERSPGDPDALARAALDALARSGA